jgi:ABC-type amino acid transport substrate-binding protein
VFKNQTGFCIDMVESISKRNHLNHSYVMTNSVKELFDLVIDGTCDLGFAGITITADREKRVDFSQPFFDSGLLIATGQQPASHITGIVKVVLRVVGFSAVLFFIALSLIAHLIWLIEKDDQDPRSFSTTYRKGILDAYWWAVVTMTTVGYGDKCPKKISGRMIAGFWMIIGIIWFAGFTATLSSAITVDHLENTGISDLSDLNGRTVGIISGTTSESFLRYHNVDRVTVGNLDALIALIKNKLVDAIVYDAPVLLYTAKNDPDIKIAGKMFDEQRYGVVFPESNSSELKELFNIEILNMMKNGEYDRIYDKWF